MSELREGDWEQAIRTTAKVATIEALAGVDLVGISQRTLLPIDKLAEALYPIVIGAEKPSAGTPKSELNL